MSSRVVLHAGPAVGFDQPFEMLAACHERVRRSLGLLQRLHAHVQRHGADAQACSAAADVLRYFDLAGPAHHEDEERHVLPRLRAMGRVGMADRLHADHEDMARQWAALRGPLACWAEGEFASVDAALIQNYIDLYRSHLLIEDTEAFALACNGLPVEQLAAMGSEMASRRRG